MTAERLLEFATAWGSHDLERIMSFFTNDCIYAASVGPEPGATYRGFHAVRAGIAEMLEHDDGSTATISNLHILGDMGFWEWTYTFPDDRSVQGCDLFEFVEDRIRIKNAFRKTQA
jgi:ketosteroid isomerase-like protein